MKTTMIVMLALMDSAFAVGLTNKDDKVPSLENAGADGSEALKLKSEPAKKTEENNKKVVPEIKTAPSAAPASKPKVDPQPTKPTIG